MVVFSDLPPEIRLRILEFAISSFRVDTDYELSEFPLYHGISKYALVNREWQAFVESVNFRRIVVDEDRLDEFQVIFRASQKRRRKYVSQISLEILLPEADEVDKWTAEDKILEMQLLNSGALSRAVWKLFFVLCDTGWKLEETRSCDDTGGFGLTLEIVIAGDIPTQPLHPDSIDTEHDATRLLLDQRAIFSPSTLIRLAATKSWPPKPKEKPPSLPTLDFVRRLCLPAFGQPPVRPKVVVDIANSLHGLTHLVFERLCDTSDISARETDVELSLALDGLPSTIKSMSFFEESGEWTPVFREGDDDHDDDFDHDDGDHQKQPRVTTVSLVRRLMERTRNLEQLALSFWVDAVDFLHPFIPSSAKKTGGRSRNLPSWPKLHTLTLTSFCLSRNHEPDDVNGLLVGAARAAMRMPKLRTLEIYNVKKGRVEASFLYKTTDKSAVIRWESGWAFDLSDKVRTAWAEVVKKYSRHEHGLKCESCLSSPPGPYFSPTTDAVPLKSLETRTLALYDMSAREYSQQWLNAFHAADEDGEDDGWETASDWDED